MKRAMQCVEKTEVSSLSEEERRGTRKEMNLNGEIVRRKGGKGQGTNVARVGHDLAIRLAGSTIEKYPTGPVADINRPVGNVETECSCYLVVVSRCTMRALTRLTTYHAMERKMSSKFVFSLESVSICLTRRYH